MSYKLENTRVWKICRGVSYFPILVIHAKDTFEVIYCTKNNDIFCVKAITGNICPWQFPNPAQSNQAHFQDSVRPGGMLLKGCDTSLRFDVSLQTVETKTCLHIYRVCHPTHNCTSKWKILRLPQC